MKTHDDVFRKLTKNNSKRIGQVRIEALKAKLLEGLVELREMLGLFQAEIAKRIGMKQQVISRVENGENVTINTLIRYMDGLRNVAIVKKAKLGRKSQVLRFIKELESFPIY